MVTQFITHAECVSPGHPDKIADLISDTVLDVHLHADPFSRVAVETVVSNNRVDLFGEISSKNPPSKETIESAIREAISSIGYKKNLVEGFEAETVEIHNHTVTQSPEIAQGVDIGGAGDQGIMYGTSTKETKSGLPLCQKIAADLMYSHSFLIKNGSSFLKPDAKSQVVVENRGGSLAVNHITLALSHTENCTRSVLTKIAESLVETVLIDNDLPTNEHSLTVNGTGSFVNCGPATDSGLTGRKIIVDQVAGYPVGGGAFSGKCPTKVDRSAAYFARYLANHLIEAGVAETATVGISYTIGCTEQDAVSVKLINNRTTFSEEEIARILENTVSFSPANIIEKLDLRTPFYRDYCNFSHYYKKTAPWECIDPKLVETIKQILM